MPQDLQPNLTFENRRILYRNFAGQPDQFNPQGGKRTFSVVLEEDEGKAMEADGWNVKFPPPREEGDVPIGTLKVNVKYGGRGRPPRVMLVTKRNKTQLDETTVASLDWADITNVDLTVRPYHWEVGGKTGISAYLVTAWVTINEDPLDAKYADVPSATDIIEPPEPD